MYDYMIDSIIAPRDNNSLSPNHFPFQYVYFLKGSYVRLLFSLIALIISLVLTLF